MLDIQSMAVAVLRKAKEVEQAAKQQVQLQPSSRAESEIVVRALSHDLGEIPHFSQSEIAGERRGMSMCDLKIIKC